MKVIYSGTKEEIGPCYVNVRIEAVTANKAVINYALQHIERHSPDGFQWGYGGSGPADLSLAILTDYCTKFKIDNKEIPNKYYQQFKKDFLESAGQKLEITSEQIKGWLEKNNA